MNYGSFSTEYLYNGKNAPRACDRNFKELKMNKAELALRMNFSRSAVSQYLNGKYNSNPEALEEKLTEFVKEYEEHVKSETEEVKAIGRTVSGVKPKIAYFESKDYIQTIGVCKSCQENMALGIIVAKSGYGKTHALKKYAKMPRVAYIRCDDTMAWPGSGRGY